MASKKAYKVNNGDIIIGNKRSYKVLNCIGRGGFGKVVRCLNLSAKKEVALKVHCKNNKDDIKDELEMLQKVSALDSEENNIVKFIDHFEFRERYFFAFEMLDKSLWHLMSERDWVPLKLSQISYVMEQLLVAFKGLKSIGIMHCDLKLDNIMLVNHRDQPFKIKLIDFGLAIDMSKLELGLQVYPLVNRAPEVILALPLSEAVDIWAIASVICQLYFKWDLFPRECIYYAMKGIVKLLGLPSDRLLENAPNTKLFLKRGEDGVWEFMPPEVFESLAEIETNPTVSLSDFCDTLREAVLFSKNQDELSQKHLFLDLLSRCLEVNPAQRITVEEALQHEFITHKASSDDNNIVKIPTETTDSESSDSQSNSSFYCCADGSKSCKCCVISNKHSSNSSGSNYVPVSDAAIKVISPLPFLDNEQEEEDDINCANPVEIKPGDAVPELPIYTREISKSEHKKVEKKVNNYNLNVCAATSTECSHNIDSSSSSEWEYVFVSDASNQIVLPPSSLNIKQVGTLMEDNIDRARREEKPGDPVQHLPGYIGEINEDDDQKFRQTTSTVNNNDKEKLVIFSSSVDAIAITPSEDLSSSSRFEHNVNSNNQSQAFHIKMQQKTIQNLLAEVRELRKNYKEAKYLLKAEQQKTKKLRKKLEQFTEKEEERDCNVAPIPELKEKKPSLWKRFKQLFKRE